MDTFEYLSGGMVSYYTPNSYVGNCANDKWKFEP